jgi:predicted lipoprotein with Yx(FWY)xxD motif
MAAATAVMTVGGLVVTSAASAQVEGQKTTKVVKETVRGTFGEILTNTKGLTLYIEPTGTCTGGCLTIWPPLLMPKGKTMPGGIATGLGTVKKGKRLQVTYEGKRLYTFYEDSGTSTLGENVGGFVVAQVSAPAA